MHYRHSQVLFEKLDHVKYSPPRAKQINCSGMTPIPSGNMRINSSSPAGRIRGRDVADDITPSIKGHVLLQERQMLRQSSRAT